MMMMMMTTTMTMTMRMMPPPGLQVYLWPRVILTFDFLTQVDHFMSLLRGRFVPTGIKTDSFVFKISCLQV